MRVEFFPAAERELAETAEDYEAKSAGLGSDFILEVERIAAVLIELPSLGEKLDPIHRRIPLRRFPYALIFRRDGEVIRIVAVAHRRRKPQYWTPRVQDR
jgi:plasmid stabilization system protein ParE